jgi:hypothetical protein
MAEFVCGDHVAVLITGTWQAEELGQVERARRSINSAAFTFQELRAN